MKNIYFLLSFSFLVVQHVSGQTQDTSQKTTAAPLPPGPLLARASDSAKWVVHYSYFGSSTATGGMPITANNHRIVTVTVAKTPQAIQQVTVYSDGTKFEQWIVGLFQFSMNGSQPTLVAPTARHIPEDMSYLDFSQADFPDFAWISKSNFKGFSQQAGHKCLVFIDNITPDQAEGLRPQNQMRQFIYKAMIDYEKRLPLLLSHREEMRIYEYSELDPVNLVPPDSVTELKQAELTMLKHVQSQAGRPF